VFFVHKKKKKIEKIIVGITAIIVVFGVKKKNVCFINYVCSECFVYACGTSRNTELCENKILKQTKRYILPTYFDGSWPYLLAYLNTYLENMIFHPSHSETVNNLAIRSTSTI